MPQAPAASPLKSGQDVSSLMSGADVTALMGGGGGAPAPAGAPQLAEGSDEGFIASIARQFGLRHPIDTASALLHMIGTMDPGALAVQMGTAAGQDITQKVGRAYDKYKTGDTHGAIREATGAVPFIGPGLQLGQDQVATGNLKGAAGTAVGMIAPLVMGSPTVQEGAAALTAPVKAGMENAAARVWSGAAKPVKAALQRTQEAQGGEPLAMADQAVAKTVLKTGLGRISPGNADKLSGIVDSLNTQMDQMLANSTGTVAKADIEKAILGKASQMLESGATGGTPNLQFTQDEVHQALAPIFGRIEDLPETMTATQAQGLKTSALKGVKRFGLGTTNDADQGLRKATGAGAAAAIRQAEPNVAPLTDQMSQLIPARDIMDHAAMMAGRRNAVGTMGDIAAAASHSPLSTAMAVLSRPSAQSTAAQALWNVAQGMPSSTQRAALLSLLGQAGASQAPPGGGQ